VGQLHDWEGGQPFSGHNSPAFAPNLLNLLADMGLQRGDAPRVDVTLERMLAHQDEEGRFQSFAAVRGGDEPVWGALLCDSHAIIEVLVRFGYHEDPRVRAGLARMGLDLTSTSQGLAWPCRRDPVTGFRGPGRKGDFCPQVTLEALRTFALLPESERPQELLDVARVSLSAWRARGEQKPYMFGHGRTFKIGKWPATWYSALTVLDALGRYPALWRGNGAEPEDRRALIELVACLIAYSMNAEGQVVPQSTFRGFAEHSFGQKSQPSPSPRHGCSRSCIDSTTWPRRPAASTSRGWPAPRGVPGIRLHPRELAEECDGETCSVKHLVSPARFPTLGPCGFGMTGSWRQSSPPSPWRWVERPSWPVISRRRPTPSVATSNAPERSADPARRTCACAWTPTCTASPGRLRCGRGPCSTTSSVGRPGCS